MFFKNYFLITIKGNKPFPKKGEYNGVRILYSEGSTTDFCSAPSLERILTQYNVHIHFDKSIAVESRKASVIVLIENKYLVILRYLPPHLLLEEVQHLILPSYHVQVFSLPVQKSTVNLKRESRLCTIFIHFIVLCLIDHI